MFYSGSVSSIQLYLDFVATILGSIHIAQISEDDSLNGY